MKKWKKILLSVLAVLVLGVGAVCWWQWDNIRAVGTSLTTSREDLQQKLEENTQKVADAADKAAGVSVRDLTEEEKAALQDQTMTKEELIDRLIGKETGAESGGESEKPAEQPSQQPTEEPEAPAEQPAQPPEQPEEPPVQPPEQPEPPAPPAEEQQPPADDAREEELARLIAEIYVMQAEYTELLSDMYNDCIEEWIAMPEAERTTVNKYKLGMKYMEMALEKEAECDARMAAIEEQIRALLVAMGRDTALVDEIHAAYKEEKELKKAFYLGLHS